MGYFAAAISLMMMAAEAEIISDTTMLRGDFFERLVTYFE